jgi:uncharacterized membrane protein
MEEGGLKVFVELSATGIELLGIAIIVIAFLYALILAAVRLGNRREDWFVRLKTFIGRALQLSLEFLIAADIIRTILVAPTRENILVLGMLIIVRTVLSWSIAVEIEGCWPWQMAKMEKAEKD